MVDYSRAVTSRAAKSSFDQAAQSLIAEIQALQAEYETEWKKVEELRKSRASLIENIIPILKRNEVKLARPLSKCDNSELMEELSNTVNSLDTTPQEEIKVAMVRIESRYDQLVKQAKKLDALYERLSSYYVPEKDYGDEVVVSIKGHKKKKSEEENNTVKSYKDSSLYDLNGEAIVGQNPIEPAVDAPNELGQFGFDEEEQSFSELFRNDSVDFGSAPIQLEIDETPLVALNALGSLEGNNDAFEMHEEAATAEEQLVEHKEEDVASSFVPSSTLDLELDSDDLDFDAVSNFLGKLDGELEDYEHGDSADLEQSAGVLPDVPGKQDNYHNDDLDQVTSFGPAAQELIAEVESLIDSKKIVDYSNGLPSVPVVEGNSKESRLYSEPSNDDVEPEFHIYSLNSEQTLSQIVDYVYEGNLTWYDLYRYADNEEVISKKCEKLGVDVEDAANTPGILADLELKYPKNFVPYEEKSYGKAA